MLGTKEQRTEGMKRQAQELIEQAYDRGYKAGLVDNQTFHESMCEKCKNGLIEQGRNEAWEVVKKIAKMPTDESEPIFNKFGLHSIMECYTASEAIEKLKAWEQKQQENKNPGWKEYSDIKSKCEELLAKGYTKAMLKTVIEQMKEGAGE